MAATSTISEAFKMADEKSRNKEVTANNIFWHFMSRMMFLFPGKPSPKKIKRINEFSFSEKDDSVKIVVVICA